MIHEIWSPLDKLRHYWIDDPVWTTLCGKTVSAPYGPEEAPHGDYKELCEKCGGGAETMFNLLRQDLKGS